MSRRNSSTYEAALIIKSIYKTIPNTNHAPIKHAIARAAPKVRASLQHRLERINRQPPAPGPCLKLLL